MGKLRVWVKAALASVLISHRIKSEFVAYIFDITCTHFLRVGTCKASMRVSRDFFLAILQLLRKILIALHDKPIQTQGHCRRAKFVGAFCI
jgi:hypothetical protein